MVTCAHTLKPHSAGVRSLRVTAPLGSLVFSAEGPISQKTPQSQANWEGRSPYICAKLKKKMAKLIYAIRSQERGCLGLGW